MMAVAQGKTSEDELRAWFKANSTKSQSPDIP